MSGGTGDKKNKASETLNEKMQKSLSLKEILRKDGSISISAGKSIEDNLETEETTAPEEPPTEEEDKADDQKMKKALSKSKRGSNSVIDPDSYSTNHCNFVAVKEKHVRRQKMRCYRDCQPGSQFCIYHSNTK
ncbi:hypothetical protein MPTK1_3g24540 [Marchantia polymorpha subsp. ruderalis]|uniref:Uncharacterized protein n=2 Tax=Marchantia polymorpha TaxID=3197 RepID=A0A176VIQ9_MARPO|nr:hypothetical protein AXG93_203s1290 [Marchantia polymorpha subsp. ruderalis]PTQ26828.1 hypothetical protein MARPO_0326s0001 [Marchantia polymorpha]BBN06870.1 hypothetical protein Mp_3g24540 [Marchantia polymorpha subsp. ruderalis]|eukprot:PTQ26828.1 hypothetical protein MARPO_0326s0001 [Marchantia polymorpha]